MTIMVIRAPVRSAQFCVGIKVKTSSRKTGQRNLRLTAMVDRLSLGRVDSEGGFWSDETGRGSGVEIQRSIGPGWEGRKGELLVCEGGCLDVSNKKIPI